MTKSTLQLSRHALPRWLQAGLLTLAPVVWFVAHHLLESGAVSPETAQRVAHAVGPAGIALGAMLAVRAPVWARMCVIMGVLATLVSVGEALVGSPARTLVAAICASGVISVLWLARPDASTPAASEPLRVSAYLMLTAWLYAMLADASASRAGALGLVASLVVHAWYVGSWLLDAPKQRPFRTAAVGAAMAASLAAGLSVATRQPAGAWAYAAMPLMAIVSLLVTPTRVRLLEPLLGHPARLLVTTFFGLSVLGTAILLLPAASTEPLATVDAFFTSVSAVCVTGLIVVDTPHAFTPFGQAVLLLLIQVGGLGIMTFYSVALSALGRRLSLSHESSVAEAMAVEDRRELFGTLARVLRVTFVAEAVGAALLFATFAARGEELAKAAWRGVFTAVSAFCNAGFALQSDSLIPYARDPRVLHVVAGLIVLGGLSPAGVVAIPAWLRGRRLPTLQLRIVFVTSAALLSLGMLAFLAFEWDASLAGMSVANHVHNAWFQSVTLRTAGFNSVDLSATQPVTQTLMIAFMFVGGSPGGTAGGIKTTTLAVLLLAVLATLRRQSHAIAYARRLSPEVVYKAAAVITLGALSGVGALMAVQLTQRIDLATAVFEVVSALGTVGLSLGGTAQLDGVGKLLIAVCMFAGRLGPLTLILFLAGRRKRPHYIYPQATVDVG